MSWGFRHLDGPELDPKTSPWPHVRGAILAFLRHRCTDFDERLRARCEHDQAFRDSLASQVTKAAFRKYSWLGQDDPRPFPASDDDGSPARIFDEFSRGLADAHGVRDALRSAIRDLKREGRPRAQIEALEIELAKVEDRISFGFEFLTAPKQVSDAQGKSARAFPWKHSPNLGPAYFFFECRAATPNRLHYLGFRCPQCQVTVARLKQTVDFGQSYRRMVVFSCYCMTYSVVCPTEGPRLLTPMTLEKWETTLAKYDDPAA